MKDHILFLKEVKKCGNSSQKGDSAQWFLGVSNQNLAEFNLTFNLLNKHRASIPTADFISPLAKKNWQIYDNGILN